MKELISMIGKTGTIQANGWEVHVVVLDVKTVYGTDKLLVASSDQPTMHSKWINKTSFQEDSNSTTGESNGKV